jgi:hypothetical protein
MMPKIFFCADDVLVSSDAVSAGGCEFPLSELRGVCSRRASALFGESYEVILSHRLLREVSLLRHRNAYFVFQLVKAIESALAQQRALERSQPLLSA